MGSAIFGSPPKPAGYSNWEDWAIALADYLELQGTQLAELSLTGLAATPTVLGYQQIVGAVAATSLTVPAGTVVAYIQAELQQVRWLDNGATPTATVGMILDPLDILPYAGNFANFKLIEVLPTAVINICYRR